MKSDLNQIYIARKVLIFRAINCMKLCIILFCATVVSLEICLTNIGLCENTATNGTNIRERSTSNGIYLDAYELIKTDSAEKQKHLVEKIRKAYPKNSEDIDALDSLAGDNRYAAIATSCIGKIKGPLNTEVKKHLIKIASVNEKANGKIRFQNTVIWVCVMERIEEIRPIIRERIRNTPRSGIVGWVKSIGNKDASYTGDRTGQLQQLARYLIELKDIESIDLLFSRDELIETEFAGQLSRLGVGALERAAVLATNNKGKKRHGALKIIALSNCNESIPKLKELLHDQDPEIRSVSAQAICIYGGPEVEGLLNPMINDPDKRVRKWALDGVLRANPDKYKSIIVSSMWGKGPQDQMSALYLISTGSIKGIEKDIKEFLVVSEKEGLMGQWQLAAEGLWRLTGEKTLRSGVKYNLSGYYPWDIPSNSSHPIPIHSESKICP